MHSYSVGVDHCVQQDGDLLKGILHKILRKEKMSKTVETERIFKINILLFVKCYSILKSLHYFCCAMYVCSDASVVPSIESSLVAVL
jgi:hypothetical protein